jgi:hypothetical protein
LPKIPKTGLSWNEIELRLAILQILLGQRKKRPQTGGATAKMMMDILSIDNVAEMEFALWYLRETNLIEMGDRMFMISWRGVDYIVDQLSKTQVLDGGGKTEQKIKKFENVGLLTVALRTCQRERAKTHLEFTQLRSASNKRKLRRCHFVTPCSAIAARWAFEP